MATRPQHLRLFILAYPCCGISRCLGRAPYIRKFGFHLIVFRHCAQEIYNYGVLVLYLLQLAAGTRRVCT